MDERAYANIRYMRWVYNMSKYSRLFYTKKGNIGELEFCLLGFFLLFFCFSEFGIIFPFYSCILRVRVIFLVEGMNRIRLNMEYEKIFLLYFCCFQNKNKEKNFPEEVN